ncbi:hypothetical protein I546_3049 [Mycobacterium kansasii 732]|nr:hypothetical protein I546_3049 [Mycobacterium kansasii 732]
MPTRSPTQGPPAMRANLPVAGYDGDCPVIATLKLPHRGVK